MSFISNPYPIHQAQKAATQPIQELLFVLFILLDIYLFVDYYLLSVSNMDNEKPVSILRPVQEYVGELLEQARFGDVSTFSYPTVRRHYTWVILLDRWLSWRGVS